MRMFWWIAALLRRDRNVYLELSTERLQMIAKLVIAGIIWTGPKLTPAQAAEILRTAQGQSNRTNIVWSDGPRIAVIGTSEPNAGPWKFPAPAPPRRLDGTLLSDPVTLYGPIYVKGGHR